MEKDINKGGGKQTVLQETKQFRAVATMSLFLLFVIAFSGGFIQATPVCFFTEQVQDCIIKTERKCCNCLYPFKA